jgi:hypothetical protein
VKRRVALEIETLGAKYCSPKCEFIGLSLCDGLRWCGLFQLGSQQTMKRHAGRTLRCKKCLQAEAWEKEHAK